MQIIATGVALIATSAFLMPSASAQTPATPSAASTRADPLDPKAAVAPLIYRSSFQDYRLNAEVEVGSWKESNDRVRSIGGWRTYAKEARQADASAASSAPVPNAAAASAPPAAEPAAAGHTGHKNH